MADPRPRTPERLAERRVVATGPGSPGTRSHIVGMRTGEAPRQSASPIPSPGERETGKHISGPGAASIAERRRG